MAFLLAEDAALKKALQGIVVSDRSNAARPVPVYFGLPDIELRTQSYPYITIDLIDIEEARERVHAGGRELTYVPDGFLAPAANQALLVDFLTPYDITYQVTTWARNPRHDRQILAQILTNKIPHRFGQVLADAGSTTYNSTVRRLDLRGIAKRDQLDDEKKKVFRNVITAVMSAELYPFAPELVRRVASVQVGVEHNPSFVVIDSRD